MMISKLIKYLSVIALCQGTAMAAPNLPPAAFFVANEGQWEEPFMFQASVGNAVYYITSSGLTMDIRQYDRPQRARDPMDRFGSRQGPEPVTVRGHVLKMSFANANPCPEIIGQDKLSSYSNYFLGTDRSKWRSRVGHYRRVVVRQVWSGIDVEYRLTEGGVEVIYRVQPSADPSQIRVRYEGLDGPLAVAADGSLLLPTSLGLVKEKAPFMYQIVNGRQQEVACRFQVYSDQSYGFALNAYDTRAELVIDPVIYGTFLGGQYTAMIHSLDRADDGTMVATGITASAGFPTTPGAYQTTFVGVEDATVTRISAGGNTMIFSTYIGNPHTILYCQASALAPDGSVWIAGRIVQGSWPLTHNAFDTTDGAYKGFVCLLSADGTALLLSSYLGGNADDFVEAVCTDAQGFLYLTGTTASADFPITPNAMFPNRQGSTIGFLTVIEPLAHSIWYSTFIPANFEVIPSGVSASGTNHVWVWGTTRSDNYPTTPDAVQPVSYSPDYDGFFTLFDLDSNRLLYSSLWGGSRGDLLYGLSEWGSDTVVLTGYTESADFFITTGAMDSILDSLYYSDAFVTAIRLPQTIIGSTFLGGSRWEQGIGVGGGPNGITVIGKTSSTDFPITHDAFDAIYNNNGQPNEDFYDLFISRVDWHASALQYSTYYGGRQTEECFWVGFQSPDTVWFTGMTGSLDFPLTSNAVQFQWNGGWDGFISCFAIPNSPSSLASRDIVPLEFNMTTFPNPFNPSTTLAFTLSRAAYVKLKVMNVLGRTVCQTDLGMLGAGPHAHAFDGSALASGVYWARLEAGGAAQIKKMVLLK